MGSPYDKLPAEAFWRTGVRSRDSETPPSLYKKKFTIGGDTAIAAAGSCFAQHIVRNLRSRGFSVTDKELPPPGLPEEDARKFGYGIYSARYGNIYTARQLRQLCEEANGLLEPADIVWEKDGRYYDALRPSVEPHGLQSAAEVRDHREYHLKRVRRVLRTANVFIFTLGLTEAWEHAAGGTIYPTAPGTIAGDYDPSVYRFRNFTFREVYDDMQRFFEIAKKKNPDLRFILTVSPVPLTATAAGQHVLLATTYSKAVLRAVAGQLYQERADVDYVPSYEMIMGAHAAGRYFEDNLRNVRAEGVDAVMSMFFDQHGAHPSQIPAPVEQVRSRSVRKEKEDVVCEEVLLDAFAP